MYPFLHSIIERGSNTKLQLLNKNTITSAQETQATRVSEMPPSFKWYVIPIIHANWIKSSIVVNTGHAQYLVKWYCPIKKRNLTADQWIATQKAMRVAKKQQLEQQQEKQQEQQQH